MSETWARNLRPYRWDDLDSLVGLMTACEAEDRSGETTTRDVVERRLSTPGSEPDKTIRVLDDEQDGIVATCSAVHVPGVYDDSVQVKVRIRPDRRRSDLYTGLLQAAEALAHDLYPPTGRSTCFHAVVYDQPALWREAVGSAGYRPVRWFMDMLRPLDSQVPSGDPPAELRLAFLDEGIDPLVLKRAIDEAFLDHWSPQEFSDEQFLHWAKSPMFRTDLSPVVIAPNGEVVGGAIVTARDAETPSGEPVAHVDALGIRKAYRGRGAARAMLASCLRRIKAAGFHSAALDVDADNPTGATRLYSALGFVEIRRYAVYAKPIHE